VTSSSVSSSSFSFLDKRNSLYSVDCLKRSIFCSLDNVLKSAKASYSCSTFSCFLLTLGLFFFL
jgi:hypothetical protein